MVAPKTEVIVSVAGVEHARFVVEPGDYVIGRDPECDICLQAERVSDRHAQLIVNYDHALIEDLGSGDGTLVGRRPVTARTRLWPNQKIQIGVTTFELHRLKPESAQDDSVPPVTALMRRALPEEFLREKKYEIGGIIAQGGMGAVLEANEACIRRTVAMKVMLNNHSAVEMMRFINEARVTGQLEHPNIVPVHEVGVDENEQLYYTMKFVQGDTLWRVLELLAADDPDVRGKYPLSALLTVFQKVCDAIAFAHSKGVIHRDLKPSNIMLGGYGEVLVMDWGLSKSLDGKSVETIEPEAPPAGAAAPSEPLTGALTMVGAVLGTPQFMPPEQARGELDNLDPRADIYSLGAILFQVLTLQAPLAGTKPDEVLAKVARGEATVPLAGIVGEKRLPHLPGGKVPASLEAVVMKAMAVQKSARYQSVVELQRDIAAFQNGFATSAEKASLGRQFLLLVKRHKAAFAAAVAVWIIVTALGARFVWIAVSLTATAIAAWFVWQAMARARRAFADKAAAEKNLAALRHTLPTVLMVAESEAGAQRFASALEKIDVVLGIDPHLLSAYWQRAWVLLGMERWGDAADALKLAQERDPSQAKLAIILPEVQKMMVAGSDEERWSANAAREIFRHLQMVGATGAVRAFSDRLRSSAIPKPAKHRLIRIDSLRHPLVGDGHQVAGEK